MVRRGELSPVTVEERWSGLRSRGCFRPGLQPFLGDAEGNSEKEGNLSVEVVRDLPGGGTPQVSTDGCV